MTDKKSEEKKGCPGSKMVWEKIWFVPKGCTDLSCTYCEYCLENCKGKRNVELVPAPYEPPGRCGCDCPCAGNVPNNEFRLDDELFCVVVRDPKTLTTYPRSFSHATQTATATATAAATASTAAAKEGEVVTQNHALVPIGAHYEVFVKYGNPNNEKENTYFKVMTAKINGKPANVTGIYYSNGCIIKGDVPKDKNDVVVELEIKQCTSKKYLMEMADGCLTMYHHYKNRIAGSKLHEPIDKVQSVDHGDGIKSVEAYLMDWATSSKMVLKLVS